MNQFTKDLTYLETFLNKMLESSSGNHKIETIRKHSDSKFLQKIFHYTYNHFKKYGVHTKVLKKNSNLVSTNSYTDFFKLLDDLAERKITGHNAIIAVNSFIKSIPEDLQYLIYYILDRDLRMGASITSILKVHPNIVPVFKVALANPYNPKRADFTNEDWYGSRKLDGVRCICRKEGNSITFLSRSGKEFKTLDNIAKEIKKIPGNFIMDGEICLVNQDGNEDFQGIMKQIRKKNHTIKNPKFFVFDYLTLTEFDNHISHAKLTQRLKNGYNALPKNINHTRLSFLPQTKINTVDEFTEMAKDAELNGYEGIMIRKDTGYEGKRSHNLLKVKKFHDKEYTVLDCINGNIRWTEKGQQVERECLSSIIIEHKGNCVSVGSGFSKEQREYYINRHDELIGKTVTIQYFEESQNANGEYSLRFPVVKHIYKNGRDC